MEGSIRIRGARQNNLTGWDLDIPLGRWITITGVSGSGKSSLAMDVLYAEGQRRYVETFSPYARQFLERMDRPQVDEIRGIPPAIAIEGSRPVRTSRSTVGTMTELTDFLKLLFARVAVAHCPLCQTEVRRTTPESLWEEVKGCGGAEPWILCFPLPLGGRNHQEVRQGLMRTGFFRVLMGGRPVHLEKWRPRSGETSIEVVVDRFFPSRAGRERFVDSAETAFRYGKGEMSIHFHDGSMRRWTSQWRCLRCGSRIREPTPHLFSFNSPAGACSRCRGFGRIIDIDPELVVPDPSKSIREGAVKPFSVPAAKAEFSDLLAFCRRQGIPLEKQWRELSREQHAAIFDGRDGYYGVRGFFRWLEERTYKLHVRVFLSRFRTYLPCPDCGGSRLKPEALQWRIRGKTLPDILSQDVGSCLDFFEAWQKSENSNPAVAVLLDEITRRLAYLRDVGLVYLTLDRASRTLSGGEVERVLLTRALGTRLVSTLFVLDEPSIGLHARDTQRLVSVIRHLVDQGNTAVIVEHDPEIIRNSDLIVDLGPGAGSRGGRLTYAGPPSGIVRAEASLTGTCLSDRSIIPVPKHRRVPVPDRKLVLHKVRENNLKGMDVHIPLGLLVCITGVSGSGKSTLLLDVLHKGLLRALGLPSERPGRHGGLSGAQWVQRVELIDQSGLGRTPRANPATYIQAWTPIRDVFASTQDAKNRGFGPGYFSFNIPGGRCEACRGEGFHRIEMQFLSDVLLRCTDCRGRRFRGEVLEVRYRGKSVADVLQMTVEEAMSLFADHAGVMRALGSLKRMGLGYLALGQPLSTLSGGESQRLKLAKHLSDSAKNTLFLLDEPTTGLHQADVRVLLEVLNELVDRGQSVVVVEHHLDVIKSADYVIDLGPEGGDAGGWIVATGPPEAIASTGASHTGRFLRRILRDEPNGPSSKEVGSPKGSRRPCSGPQCTRIVGAREHNLQDIDLEIPRNRLVAVTGVSGSGKSTLAFDILFAEGQRRYLETLPTYVRQYFKIFNRPDVDVISGISPTVAIEQRMARAGRRSTVATLTEIYHFYRLLFARLGVQHCPRCGIPIAQGTIEEIVRLLLDQNAGRRVMLLAPKVAGRKGYHRQVMASARRSGIRKLRIDGVCIDLRDLGPLDRYREHWIDWVLAEDIPAEPDRWRELRSAVEVGLREGGGTVIVRADGGTDQTFSRSRQCPRCGLGFDELDPRHFSFNSPMGACPQCEGIGATALGIDPRPCESCGGSRLNSRARAVKVLGRTIAELCAMSVSDARRFWREARFDEGWGPVSQPICSEIGARLKILEELGLGYLTLDRSAESLSGGEAQRIRLAAQLGSNLRGVCYILDEPTIGLHPRDLSRLIRSLRALKNRGNSVIVVEHDEETIRRSDWIIDLGPGPGRQGGRVVAQGKWQQLRSDKNSVTAKYLADPARRCITSRNRSALDGKWIRVLGASQNNLKDLDVAIPLGTLTCVTGVSGSGKSSLVREVLYRGLRNLLASANEPVGRHAGILGWEAIHRVQEVDHSPIGKTPRSTPATYTKMWDEIRGLFSRLPEARSRGFPPGRFSFNVEGGRCPACGGQGVLRQEMSFLPDVYVLCEVCNGSRFNAETLSVTYRGKNIAEVLRMTVEEALDFFQAVPRLRRPLKVLDELGLGYLPLGQPSPTLSGGEAQRVKLAQELAKNPGRRTLYILDEPTTGLHIRDVGRLLNVMQQLVERGDTVVVIEHHMDVIASADHIIDLGPEGGENGGEIVAQGSPQEILRETQRSHTGRWLARFLAGDQRVLRTGQAHPAV